MGDSVSRKPSQEFCYKGQQRDKSLNGVKINFYLVFSKMRETKFLCRQDWFIWEGKYDHVGERGGNIL